MFAGKDSDLTQAIIGSFYTVYNQLGYGFNEKVYENAMKLELEALGLVVEQQKPVNVFYNRHVAGEYYADLVVNDVVILELKATRELLLEHEAQLLNYLKATEMEVGLLMNFGPKPQHIRKIYDNERKGLLTWTKKSVEP
jgi:GxxExxY protein